MKKVIFLLLFLPFMFSGCMVTKTTVGNFREVPGREYTYSKAKQIWVFWGLIPIGRAEAATPRDGNCIVETRYNFGDWLISYLSTGLVKTYSVIVTAKAGSEYQEPISNNKEVSVSTSSIKVYKVGDKVLWINPQNKVIKIKGVITAVIGGDKYSIQSTEDNTLTFESSSIDVMSIN